MNVGSFYRSNSTYDSRGGMNRDSARHNFPGYVASFGGSIIASSEI